MYILINEDLNQINKEYNNNSLENEKRFFGPINKINLFVGANNSGKSRLLRILLNNKKFTLTNYSDYFLLKEKVKEEKENIRKIEGDFSFSLTRNGLAPY